MTNLLTVFFQLKIICQAREQAHLLFMHYRLKVNESWQKLKNYLTVINSGILNNDGNKINLLQVNPKRTIFMPQ